MYEAEWLVGARMIISFIEKSFHTHGVRLRQR